MLVFLKKDRELTRTLSKKAIQSVEKLGEKNSYSNKWLVDIVFLAMPLAFKKVVNASSTSHSNQTDAVKLRDNYVLNFLNLDKQNEMKLNGVRFFVILGIILTNLTISV